MKMLPVFPIVLLACWASPSPGQERPVKATFDGAFATASVTGVQAAAQSASNYWDMSGIGRGYGIELRGGALVRGVAAFGGGFGVLGHPDSQSSSVATTAGTKSTSVSSTYFSLSVGARIPRLALSKEKKWFFTAGGDVGRSWAGSLKKTVSLCTNCGESSVDVIGGSYYEPIVKFLNARGIGVGFGYRVYSKKATLGNTFLFRVGLN